MCRLPYLFFYNCVRIFSASLHNLYLNYFNFIPVCVISVSSLPGANQYRSFDLNEEYNSWVLLARQAVVDVMFLDSNQLECQLKLHRATQNNTTITTGGYLKWSYLFYVVTKMTVVCEVRYTQNHTHVVFFSPMAVSIHFFAVPYVFYLL